MSHGDTLYTKYIAPKGDKPVFVAINGLMYSADGWTEITEELTEQGYGLLTYEFTGQNRSFLETIKSRGSSSNFYNDLEIEYFADELAEILDFYKIKTKVHLLPLSYGSSIGTIFLQKFPERVSEVTYISPLVITLEKYDPRGLAFEQMLSYIKLWGPFGAVYADQLYDMIYQNYFAAAAMQMDYGEHTSKYKFALFSQVKAVRDFDLRKVSFPPGIKINMITAEREKSIYLSDMVEAWRSIPEKMRKTYIQIPGTDHAIPSAQPRKFLTALTEIQKSSKSCTELLLNLL